MVFTGGKIDSVVVLAASDLTEISLKYKSPRNNMNPINIKQKINQRFLFMPNHQKVALVVNSILLKSLYSLSSFIYFKKLFI